MNLPTRTGALSVSLSVWLCDWLFVWLILGVGAAGCGSGDVPHGSPVLLKVYWELTGANAASCTAVRPDGGPDADPDAAFGRSNECVVWSKYADDPDLKAVVPAVPYRFNLVFDRVLDGSKIENTVTDGGVSQQVPKPYCPVSQTCSDASPVSVTWPGMEAVADQPTFKLTTWYNSVPLAVLGAAGTSYVYGRASPGYPSNTTVSIKLDKTRITSQYNEPMDGPDEIQVHTAPFALALPAPLAPPALGVATNYWVPLQFNSQLGDVATTIAPHVQVSLDGRTLGPDEYRLTVDPNDSTLVLVRPINVRDAAGVQDPAGPHPIWDSGSHLEVAVDGDLADVFGAKLGTAQQLSFLVCEPVETDGGPASCAPSMRGGGSDAGVTADAGADVPASDAPDAPDAAAEDAADDATDDATVD